MRVVGAAAVALARPDLAVVREPEPAVAVEDQVVRTAQGTTVAIPVEGFDPSRLEVDPLDAAARVARRLISGNREAGHRVPLETAVVADVHRAVRPGGGAVRAPTGLGDHRHAAVGSDAGQRAALDLDQQHAAVPHGDGTFGKLETAHDLAHGAALARAHRSLPAPGPSRPHGTRHP